MKKIFRTVKDLCRAAELAVDDISYISKNSNMIREAAGDVVNDIECAIAEDVTIVYMMKEDWKTPEVLYQYKDDARAWEMALISEELRPDAKFWVVKKNSASEKLVLKGLMP